MRHYVKTPTINQMEATECGAASLAMIFAYFGSWKPLEEMRIETGVSRDGVSAGNIMRAAKKYGLDCHGFRKEPEDLRSIPLPAIIHWNFNHFVVFEGFKGRYAYINDPASGRRRLTEKELDESFTGIVLTFAKTDAWVRDRRRKRTVFPFLRARLRGQAGILLTLLYTGVLMVFPGIVLPVLSQIFVDDILYKGNTDYLTRLLVFIAGCVILKFLLGFCRSMLLVRQKSKTAMVSGYRFLGHMLRLPMSFFDQRYAGDLVTRIRNNESAEQFLSGDLTDVALSLITALFYLVLLLLYSPVLTAVGMLRVVICAAAVFLTSARMKQMAGRMQMADGRLNGVLCAGIGISDTIKASGAESAYSGRVLGHFAKSANLEQDIMKTQQMIGILPDAADKITDVLILMAGAYLVIAGQMTVGMLLAFQSLFDSFSEPVGQLVSFAQKLQTFRSDVSRIEDIERYPDDPVFRREVPDTILKPKLDGEIELRGVSFGYSLLKPPQVEDISLRIRSGESAAFVGASGCGKSTIAKVISGLYEPRDGEILFDGIPMEELPRDLVNTSIATVSQNITLFSGTIRDNLTMWNPAVLEEDMIRAAKDACIHDFIISQPGGYDSTLSENASNLSGGQRQRLEIARALCGRPSILVMDEATSALDPLVEKEIMDNIRRRGVTCVIVAHRLSAIRDCNQIFVMDGGGIIEQGTHRMLMRQEGLYKELIGTEA